MKKQKELRGSEEDNMLVLSYLNTVLFDFDSEEEMKKIIKFVKPQIKKTRNK